MSEPGRGAGDEAAWQIVGPAIRLPDGRIVGGRGFTGHEEVRDSLTGQDRLDADGPERTDGFLDSYGRFLDRETARRLTGAARGETTEIAHTRAGAPIRELYEQLMRGEETTAAARELPTFRTYLSLGDSISIDRYPGLDVQEGEGLGVPPAGLGAPSLLRRNDERWPEFAGLDLETLCPGIRHVDLAENGATTTTVLNGQLPRVPGDLEPPLLITLTARGNDLVGLLDRCLLEAELGRADPARELVEAAARSLEEIVLGLRARFPDATLLVGTVYDPSDATGDLGDGVVRDRELEALDAFNRSVEGTARRAGAVVIPIHDHFLGHGLTEPDEDERWFWRQLVIEPSARGASEVRRLWLEALGLGLP